MPNHVAVSYLTTSFIIQLTLAASPCGDLHVAKIYFGDCDNVVNCLTNSSPNPRLAPVISTLSILKTMTDITSYQNQYYGPLIDAKAGRWLIYSHKINFSYIHLFTFSLIKLVLYTLDCQMDGNLVLIHYVFATILH